MKPINDMDPWMKYHVIVGRGVSHNKANSRYIMEELEDAGCSEELSKRLIQAAYITAISINKMMEKMI